MAQCYCVSGASWTLLNCDVQHHNRITLPSTFVGMIHPRIHPNQSVDRELCYLADKDQSDTSVCFKHVPPSTINTFCYFYRPNLDGTEMDAIDSRVDTDVSMVDSNPVAGMLHDRVNLSALLREEKLRDISIIVLLPVWKRRRTNALQRCGMLTRDVHGS